LIFAIAAIAIWLVIVNKADNQKRLLSERATSLDLSSIGTITFNHVIQQLNFPPVWIDVEQSIGIISRSDPETLFSTIEMQFERDGLRPTSGSGMACTWQNPPCFWAPPNVGGPGAGFFVVPAGGKMSDSVSTSTVPPGYTGAVVTLSK
jgi:hypothetical protein